MSHTNHTILEDAMSNEMKIFYRLLFCVFVFWLGGLLGKATSDLEHGSSEEQRLLGRIWRLHYLESETPMCAFSMTSESVSNVRYFGVFRLSKKDFDYLGNEPHKIEINLKGK